MNPATIIFLVWLGTLVAVGVIYIVGEALRRRQRYGRFGGER